MGVFRDKEYDKIAKIMCPLASSVYTVELPDKKRGLPAGELAETVKKYCPGTVASSDGNNSILQAVTQALSEAEDEDIILAIGSLSYLKQTEEAYSRLRQAKKKGMHLRKAERTGVLHAGRARTSDK